jgi:hypothetical protein
MYTQRQSTADVDAQRKHNMQVLRDFLGLLEAKDLDAWLELWDEDGEQLIPYAPNGFPKRVAGKAAIQHHYSGLPDAYGRMAFPDLKIYPMLDPDMLVAEWRGEIDVLATGRPYNNTYCGLFTFRDGKITQYKEYIDPTLLTEALGDTLGNTFSVGKA